MNTGKLKNMEQEVRIGGKGSMRRRKKFVPRSNGSIETKKINDELKKCRLFTARDVDEVIFLKYDRTVTVFKNPKIQFTPEKSMTVLHGGGVEKSSDEFMSQIDLAADQLVKSMKTKMSLDEKRMEKEDSGSVPESPSGEIPCKYEHDDMNNTQDTEEETEYESANEIDQ